MSSKVTLSTISRRIPILGFLSALLVGCWDNQGDVFDEYHSRVARVQDEDRVIQEWQFDALPRKRELNINIEPISMGLLDSYQLRECGLFNLIAERNSVLGKVADPFRNFDYQVAFLDGLSECLNHQGISDDVQQQLLSIEQQKRDQIAMHQWNLLYASDAMQSQLRGSQWLSEDVGLKVQRVSDALDYLNQSFNTSMTLGSITEVQETLEKQVVLGDLHYSLSAATFELNLITQQLKTFDHKIICGKQRDTTKFRHLNNVFEQQFIGIVQPYMAQLDGYYQQLAPNLSLFEAQPQLHPYTFPLVGTHQAFRTAIRQHVDYWKSLFERCGRKVGR
ncbi:DUF3080 family protein [Vibrio sp. D404a]|uniref:DUF3080 domain-containing protein n=1 Tax=unclassified Vibrio TaxID=2614977 RepID=UPI0025554AEB|nr:MULTISPECIES: DUF3080 domain-containing protein [unclassified Vibrio]MDK9736723.1 DUF3080 family protein [Vibrio sp. D404a]MDK9797032.1 DUF3080 family protein [Vibrio sp. D449a]